MAEYIEYHPLKFWLDPASIAEIVAHIQSYLVANPINSTTEIETIIHDYLIAHPELIGGVDSVNGETGEVVLTADNISAGNTVTIKDVLDSLQDQIDGIIHNAVRYFDEITLNVDSTILTSDITFGSGWSGDLVNGFTHTAGNTEPLVFNTQTEHGAGYIIDFDTSSQSANPLYISIGDEPLVDTYNGTTHIRIGIISDGGFLKITPSIRFASPITNLMCRKIIQDGGTEIIQTVKNVKDISLGNNITGFYNVGIGGENTLKTNQNGSRNVAIGYMALRDLKSGTRNICIGTFAMPYVTEGDRNIAIGADTLYDTKNITTRKAYDNIAIGKAAIQSGSNIQQNVGIGSNALGECGDSAIGNVAIGYQANYRAGNNNVAIGKNANYFTPGSNNVAIGYGSGGSQSANVISNSISIGYNVNTTKSNQMVIGGTYITEVILCGNKKINFNSDGTVTWESVE